MAKFLSEQGKIKQYNKIIDKINKEITEVAWYGRSNCSISFYDYEIEKSYLLAIEKELEEMGYCVKFRALKTSEEVFLLELNISWEKEEEEHVN